MERIRWSGIALLERGSERHRCHLLERHSFPSRGSALLTSAIGSTLHSVDRTRSAAARLIAGVAVGSATRVALGAARSVATGVSRDGGLPGTSEDCRRRSLVTNIEFAMRAVTPLCTPWIGRARWVLLSALVTIGAVRQPGRSGVRYLARRRSQHGERSTSDSGDVDLRASSVSGNTLTSPVLLGSPLTRQ
jgi:hypothetical protein